MSFRDQEEQEEYYHRNRHWLDKQALEKARQEPPKRTGTYWTAPHEEAADPVKPV